LEKKNTDIQKRLEQLQEKYAAMGQDMVSYLDGLIYADVLRYWDYIHLDVLLNLQTPRTSFKDENIFIIYHQITELYFKLILQEIHILADDIDLDAKEFSRRVSRVNRYFDQLIVSFDIMIDGMDHEEFLKFRMSLLPASGFQSAQYRMIELCSTSVDNLIDHRYRDQLEKSDDLVEKYNYLYWKQGATELATGKKTLTLKQFEEKYSDEFIHLIRNFYHKNLWQRFLSLPESEQQDETLRETLRNFDRRANIMWPLSHYKSAVRHLNRKRKEIEATGGTNWQEYLPPAKQLITFFPDLWTEEERDDWGKRADLDDIFRSVLDS